MPNGENLSKLIFKYLFSGIKFQHTNHLQSIDIYGPSNYSSFRIQLGSSQTNGHAYLSISITSYRQTALALQTTSCPTGEKKKKCC